MSVIGFGSLKVIQSLCVSEQALRAALGSGSQNFNTISMCRCEGCQPHTPTAFTPKEIGLVLISPRSFVDPKATGQPEGLTQ
jgi:hypothetical protein